MGFLKDFIDRIKGTLSIETEPGALYAPISGTYIPMEDIPDAVFADGVLGPCCGIEPEDETVYAPCNGTVSNVIDTKHAIGITSDDGADLLIHVGMDTVEMRGDGFRMFVSLNQKVRCGQKLFSFSKEKIKAAGHPCTCAFVVTNPDDFSSVSFETGRYFEKTEKVGQIDFRNN